jgi:hypothetical protein
MSRSRLACRLGLIVVAWGTSSCAPVVQANHRQDRPAARAPMLQLWRNPTDLAQRDLRWGPGRAASAPLANAVYTVVKRDATGYSPGYDVVGPDKRKWSIKVGKEAQPEIVLSRILWALGYYQPETYFVKGWQLVGEWSYEGQPARFRLGRQSVRRHDPDARAHRHQPAVQQLGSENQQQSRLHARGPQSRTNTAVCRPGSGRIAGAAARVSARRHA